MKYETVNSPSEKVFADLEGYLKLISIMNREANLKC